MRFWILALLLLGMGCIQSPKITPTATPAITPTPTLAPSPTPSPAPAQEELVDQELSDLLEEIESFDTLAEEINTTIEIEEDIED